MPKAFLCCQVNGLLQKLLAVSAATILRGNGDVGDVGGSRRIVVHIACTETDHLVSKICLYCNGICTYFFCKLLQIHSVNMRMANAEKGKNFFCCKFIRLEIERRNGLL